MLLGYIDRFGAEEVFGRHMGISEMRRMAVCENVVNSYRERQNSQDWSEWATGHPDQAAVLTHAHRMAVEMGLSA